MSPRLISVGRSHRGLVREHNEDAWLARPDIGLWAVADGMGGHARGDFASRTVIEALGRVPPPDDAPGHLRAVETALISAHDELQHIGGHEVCGSTVVALLAFDDHFAVTWAGDSRAYRWRSGLIEPLTRDHSVVADLVASGELAAEAARLHPHRNRITRALGIPGPLALDHRQSELQPDDVILLCSDGLSGELDEATITRLVASRPIAGAADALIDATLAAGAPDNVTVVLIEVEGSPIEETWPGG